MAGRPGPRARGAVIRAGLLAAAAAALGACGGGGGEPGLPICELGFPPPRGFSVLETVEIPEADHVGVRTSYRDQDGRELHFTSGISGEFTEGAAAQGILTVSTGARAGLFGGARDWLLMWTEDGPCTVRTAAGNGFGREEFLEELVHVGVLGPEEGDASTE